MAAFVPWVFRRMHHSHGLTMPSPAFERTAQQPALLVTLVAARLGGRSTPR
jgi:hypothetical protein